MASHQWLAAIPHLPKCRHSDLLPCNHDVTKRRFRNNLPAALYEIDGTEWLGLSCVKKKSDSKVTEHRHADKDE